VYRKFQFRISHGSVRRLVNDALSAEEVISLSEHERLTNEAEGGKSGRRDIFSFQDTALYSIQLRKTM
jgi:hypothetical protein